MSLRQRDAELETLASHWNRLPDDVRRDEAKRLGEDPAAMQRYVGGFVNVNGEGEAA